MQVRGKLTRAHAHTHTDTHTDTPVSHTYTHMCHTHAHTHTHTQTLGHTHMFHTHTCVTHAHTHAHTCTRIHTHTLSQTHIQHALTYKRNVIPRIAENLLHQLEQNYVHLQQEHSDLRNSTADMSKHARENGISFTCTCGGAQNWFHGGVGVCACVYVCSREIRETPGGERTGHRQCS